MNPLHYPSLELCKKLTEAGFLDETMAHYRKNNSDIYEFTFGPWNDESYVCPSVMELLDELVFDCLGSNYDVRTDIFNSDVGIYEKCDNCRCGSYCGDWKRITPDYTTLPNALAEMWLHLKENDLLPKK